MVWSYSTFWIFRFPYQKKDLYAQILQQIFFSNFTMANLIKFWATQHLPQNPKTIKLSVTQVCFPSNLLINSCSSILHPNFSPWNERHVGLDCSSPVWHEWNSNDWIKGIRWGNVIVKRSPVNLFLYTVNHTIYYTIALIPTNIHSKSYHVLYHNINTHKYIQETVPYIIRKHKYPQIYTGNCTIYYTIT